MTTGQDMLVERGRTGKVPTPELGVTLSHRPMTHEEWRSLGKQAADLIEAQSSLLKTAIEALEPFGGHPEFHASDDWAVTFIDEQERTAGVTAGDFRRAAKALATLNSSMKDK